MLKSLVKSKKSVKNTLTDFFSAALLALRKKRGLTQRRFGTALGFGGGAKVRIFAYESGKQAILAHISLLARYIQEFGLYKPRANDSLEEPTSNAVNAF